MPGASSNVRPFTIRCYDFLGLLKLKSLQHLDSMYTACRKHLSCQASRVHGASVHTFLQRSQCQTNLMLTAYDDLEDKLKVRSSTLKALVLLFSTSFDDRKPSNPCKTWHVPQMMMPVKQANMTLNMQITLTTVPC